MNVIQNGEQSIVLQLSYYDTLECVRAIRSIYLSLEQNRIPGIVSIRPALDMLLIEFADPLSAADVKNWIRNRPAAEETKGNALTAVKVPVCYEDGFAADMPDVCKYTGLSREEIIQQHTSANYVVWMIGFMPGFPYLGKLDDRLRVPRKANPVALLPAGSVAIAEEFIGVYPFDSPGGWHVIGRTPLAVTDYSRQKPFLFDYGITVNFYSISAEQFQSMDKK